jgi:ABC-2 type transport system permease protein
MAGAMPLSIALSFVVFFYFINTLYEDRSNRSVLFWKSLPISDRDTVLSKLATGLLLAPFLTWVVAFAVGIAMTLLIGCALLLLGVNVFGAVLSNTRTYTLPFEYLAIGPVYMLWALPTAGWLMMVSAWAKSRPFLWVVGPPLVSGILLGWIKEMFGFAFSAAWYMEHVVGRLLVGIVPGSWTLKEGFRYSAGFGGESASAATASTPLASWQLLATPELWIGVALGIAMIVAAIRLRRYRDEG